MNILYIHFFISLAFFIAVMGFYLAVMIDKLGVGYIQRYGLTCVYFSVASAAMIYSFSDYFIPLTRDFSAQASVFLITFLVVNIFIYWVARKYLKRPVELIERSTHQTFLRMDYRYLLSKSFEIIFQQTAVVLLVLILAKLGLSLASIIVIFALGFGASHVPLLFLDRKTWGWYYTFFSVIAGFIFPPLILRVQSGCMYTFIIHLSFYTFAGIFFWIHHDKPLIKGLP